MIFSHQLAASVNIQKITLHLQETFLIYHFHLDFLFPRYSSIFCLLPTHLSHVCLLCFNVQHPLLHNITSSVLITAATWNSLPLSLSLWSCTLSSIFHVTANKALQLLKRAAAFKFQRSLDTARVQNVVLNSTLMWLIFLPMIQHISANTVTRLWAGWSKNQSLIHSECTDILSYHVQIRHVATQFPV